MAGAGALQGGASAGRGVSLGGMPGLKLLPLLLTSVGFGELGCSEELFSGGQYGVVKSL